ncbi:MAG: non-heme iron oxygenase ferredoxin subunit [Dehalococcoidia bacterium]|nr:non-heme iron oxygenase ferredoxin subunit [Dehalococcoidia bacterium]
MSRHRLCAPADVPPGEVRVLPCGTRELAVSNIGGTLYAIDDVCTHDGGPLGEGTLRGDRLICPRHGAAFNARTGKVLTLPAVRDVRAYPVSVEGDGVYVQCDGGESEPGA